MKSWEDFKKHREQAIKDHNVYICLLDHNGNHIIDLPPHSSITYKTQKLSHTDCDIEIPLSTGTFRASHLVTDELIAEDLVQVDSVGRLVPSFKRQRLLLIEEEGRREVYRVAKTDAQLYSTQTIPNTAIVNGISLTDYLEAFPAPANLKAWREAKWHKIDRDWVNKPWSKERLMAEVQMAEIADGFSETGKADKVIKKIIQDSIDAVGQSRGWSKPHMVVDQSPNEIESPDATIRLTDVSIWETVADYALYAGITIDCNLWLPGDDPVYVRTAYDVNTKKETFGKRTFDHPIIVVKVIQGEH